GSLIERVEAKEIAMDSPRWAGASVTDLAEIVPALADGELWLLYAGPWLERRHEIRRDSLVERRDAGRQVVEYPVRPGSQRCIGIVADQDQRAGSLRNARPFQGRGPVRAVAGELPGIIPPSVKAALVRRIVGAAGLTAGSAAPRSPQPDDKLSTRKIAAGPIHDK